MELLEELKRIRAAADGQIRAVSNSQELAQLRTKFLGRKGELTSVLRRLSELSLEERRTIGKLANEIKDFLTSEIDKKEKELIPIESFAPEIDITLPGRKLWVGRKHPITQTLNEIVEIFVGMGFREELGPEIETEWYNYTALNFPLDHPARDMMACFYLNNEYLLRSHTSPVQIRVMEREKPPVRIIAPGRVFRPDDFDASHSPVFHQVEGLYVDEGVSLAELKGTLEVFCREMFGPQVKVRFAPSYFPFTEPSAEVAISCQICEGQGCQTCKNSGWLEILGAGLVHPNVLKNVGYNIKKYSGYAFGMGVERIAMIKYRIDDIRLFYENDLRFLEQF